MPFVSLASRAVFALALFGLAPACAAQTETPAQANDIPDHSTPTDPDATVPDPADLTPAEEAVRETIQREGVHVVHFWAPWCGNSTGELAKGWYEVVERHPEATFTFVTVWNDGETGQATLDRYAIPERVRVLTQEDHGPSADKSLRRKTFLGLPVTWIPTTWVFNREGDLAYAFNYGEVEMEQLDAAIADAAREW